MKTSIRGAPLLLLMLLAMPAMAYEFDTIQVSGRAPGDPLGPALGAGIDWTNSNPVLWYINAAGQVAFQRQLSGVPTTADGGIWTWDNGTKQLLVREGDPLPVPGFDVRVGDIGTGTGLSLSDAKAVMFENFLTGPEVTVSNDKAYLMANADGSLTVIAREADFAPGDEIAIYQHEFGPTERLFEHSTAAPLMSPDGRVLVAAQIVGPEVDETNNRLIYVGLPGNLQVIAREDDPAPGVTAGPTLGRVLGSTAGANSGQQLFYAGLRTVENPSIESEVLYRYNAGETTLIAIVGLDSGIPGRILNDRVRHANINAAGDVIFTATVSGSSAEALFKASGGSDHGVFVPLAGPSMAAPGAGDGVTFNNNPGNSGLVDNVLTASGDVAFLYDLAGDGVTPANDRGIWINDASGTRLALREGDAAGDLAGLTIGTLRQFTFNDNQNLVVVSDLVGAPAAADRALWWVQPDGGLELLLREGDMFDVDPSAGVDNRTITDFGLGGYFASGGFSRSGAFNDGDQLAFSLSFDGGTSGLFVTDLSPVPEPTSTALICLGALTLAARRRRNIPTSSHERLTTND